MANINIEEKNTLLGKILDNVQDVLMVEGKCDSAEAIAALSKVTEMPVIEDSIEVDLGSIDAAYTKTTDGTIIASRFTKGDPSCTMNVATIDGKANSMFAEKVGAAANVELDGKKLAMQGYSGKVVVKTCTIIMRSADKESMVAFPNCKVSASLKPTGGGDANTGYWEVTFVPLMNIEGAQLYLSDGSEVEGD